MQSAYALIYSLRGLRQTRLALIGPEISSVAGYAKRGHRVGVAALMAGVLVVALALPAAAGGGPENVFLLVNANSDSSKTIANHYISLRRIPARNVMYVDWKGSVEFGNGKVFREKLLKPAVDEMATRGIGAQIDYIIYSSDFPWRYELGDLFPPEVTFQQPFTPIASLTGATYYASLLVADPPLPLFVLPNMNWYVPQLDERNVLNCQSLGEVPSRGFRFRYFWDNTGQHTQQPTKGQRYFLSTMLGVTSGRGNTVDEVISYLRRAAAADGNRPRGTIYFLRNGDPRSVPRHACFDSVAAQINRLGIQTRVMEGTIPNNAPDIMGLMTGVATFDFAATRSTILPGAICEHLTSAGGMMASNGSQTPLTQFLKFGAAGASGTVIEPRAIQAKFPLPSLQLHYARGCSLAESFYQSISGPYQILIVGDPLCQPWAVFPQVKAGGISAGEELKGTVTIAPLATAAEGHRVGTFELYVDGRLIARAPPGTGLSLDTTKLADGYHEVRIVGVHEDAIETQGRIIVPIVVNNRQAELKFVVAEPSDKVARGAKIRVSASQPGATAISIRQNSREVARVMGELGETEIDATTLGRGPTTLQAFSEGDLPAVSKPWPIRIE